MRSTFGHHYSLPDDDDLEAALKGDAIVAFDTSVLLNLYQASESVRGSFFDILKVLGGRLFLPYQVGVEYHRRRVSVIQDIESEYRDLAKKVDELAAAGSKFAKGRDRRDRESVDAVKELVKEATEGLKKKLASLRDKDPHRVDPTDDKVRERFEDAFDERVGRTPRPKRVAKLVREFMEVRLPLNLPPGTLDAGKTDPAQAAGDYLIWRELLGCAKRRDRDVIFVTDDLKPDWWRKGGDGIPNMPHPHLVSEFRESTGRDYYQLTTVTLLAKAESLGVTVRDEDIEEAEASQGEAFAALERQIAQMGEIYKQALDFKALTGLDPDLGRSLVRGVFGDKPVIDFVPKFDFPMPKIDTTGWGFLGMGNPAMKAWLAAHQATQQGIEAGRADDDKDDNDQPEGDQTEKGREGDAGD